MLKNLIKSTIKFAAKELVREYVEQMSAKHPLFGMTPVVHSPYVQTRFESPTVGPNNPGIWYSIGDLPLDSYTWQYGNGPSFTTAAHTDVRPSTQNID